MSDFAGFQGERCCLCNCRLHRTGVYAAATHGARSRTTRHHLVAERFFGRSANRPGTVRPALLDTCPWDAEGVVRTFCYECHEILIHNPAILPPDLEAFAALIRKRGLSEDEKPLEYGKIAGRIELFQEVISEGLRSLAARENSGSL